MKKYFKLLLMAVAILSLNSCDEFDGPSMNVTKLADLNGVWKATNVDGVAPKGLDYLAIVEGARWGMLREGDIWVNSISTTIAGDGSNEIYLTNAGTVYLKKFTGSTLEIEYKGETRKYKLDKKASTAIIHNKKITGGGRRFVVYEEDINGNVLYKIDLGELSTTHFRGPVCLYTNTLYADVYDYYGKLVDQVYWTDLKEGVNYTLTYN